MGSYQLCNGCIMKWFTCNVLVRLGLKSIGLNIVDVFKFCTYLVHFLVLAPIGTSTVKGRGGCSLCLSGTYSFISLVFHNLKVVFIYVHLLQHKKCCRSFHLCWCSQNSHLVLCHVNACYLQLSTTRGYF